MTYKLAGDKISQESVFLVRLDPNLTTSTRQTGRQLSPKRQQSRDVVETRSVRGYPLRLRESLPCSSWQLGRLLGELPTAADFAQLVWAPVGSGRRAGGV